MNFQSIKATVIKISRTVWNFRNIVTPLLTTLVIHVIPMPKCVPEVHQENIRRMAAGLVSSMVVYFTNTPTTATMRSIIVATTTIIAGGALILAGAPTALVSMAIGTITVVGTIIALYDNYVTYFGHPTTKYPNMRTVN